MTQEADERPEKTRTNLISRTNYLFLGVLFLVYSFMMWFYIGYLDIIGLALIWILIVISGISIVYSISSISDSKFISMIPTISLFLAAIIFLLGTINMLPIPQSDELAIDYYSAHIFLSHLNPYVDSNMYNALLYYHLHPNSITPTLNGSMVTSLIYPGLIVLLFVPVVILNLPAYFVPYIFIVVLLVLIYAYYEKKKFRIGLPVLAALMLVSLVIIADAYLGMVDSIWVFFLSISFIFRKKPWVSGIFYGLAVSAKQVPAIIFPFMLFLVFKENGSKYKNALYFFLAGAFSFFATNAPFIIMGPGAWLKHVISAVNQKIIGAGIGPSILFFNGTIQISSGFLVPLLIIVFALLFLAYVIYFNKLKYAFFVFPIFVFILFFRTLQDYIMYWPFLALLVLPDLFEDFKNRDNSSDKHSAGKKSAFSIIKRQLSNKRKFATLFIATLLVAVSVSAFYYSGNSTDASTLKITGISSAGNPAQVSGYITSLDLNVSYSPTGNLPVNMPVSFRIIPSSPLNNVNALLWTDVNSTLHPGSNHIRIVPNTFQDFLKQNARFVLVAYYNNYSAYFSDPGISLNSNIPINNPSLSYPTYDYNNPFPGWSYQSNGTLKETFSYAPNGIFMNINSSSKSLYRDSLSTPINFTYLANANCAFSYNLTWQSRGLQSYFNYSLSDYPVTFAGMILSFDNGLDTFWIGYNSSVKAPQFYGKDFNNKILITNSTILNFSLIQNYISSFGWGSIDSTTMSIVLESSYNPGAFGASFYNFSLRD